MAWGGFRVLGFVWHHVDTQYTAHAHHTTPHKTSTCSMIFIITAACSQACSSVSSCKETQHLVRTCMYGTAIWIHISPRCNTMHCTMPHLLRVCVLLVHSDLRKPLRLHHLRGGAAAEASFQDWVLGGKEQRQHRGTALAVLSDTAAVEAQSCMIAYCPGKSRPHVMRGSIEDAV